MAGTALEILGKAKAAGCSIHLPVDIVVAWEFKAGARNETLPVAACPADAMILDAGPQTVAALEGVLMVAVTLILFSGAALFGHSVIPSGPLAVLEAFFGLWLAGIGFGLMASVANGLIRELGKIIHMTMMPLYIISGVMFPISAVPEPYQSWLLLNPVAHGLEAARLGFVPNYHSVPDLSMGFLYGFALVSIFLGLALHRRFALRLISL